MRQRKESAKHSALTASTKQALNKRSYIFITCGDTVEARCGKDKIETSRWEPYGNWVGLSHGSGKEGGVGLSSQSRQYSYLKPPNHEKSACFDLEAHRDKWWKENWEKELHSKYTQKWASYQQG